MEKENLGENTIYDKKSNKQYKLVKQIGQGGFAKCWMIEDENGAKLAAKIVKKSDLKKEKTRVKLQSEIKIHLSLSHKHIIDLQRVFEDSSNVYLIMELAEKKTLVELLKSKGRISEPHVKFYLKQIIDAVSYMHERNVIHRDLKLGNLFINSNGDIKIGDFGLAAVVSEGERKQTICGTPNYIAPEVLFDNGHSFQVDIWSIGVILYTLLVGKPPFQCKEVKQIYQNIKENKYSFPPGLEISDEAKLLIGDLLNKDPENRPSLEQITRYLFFTKKEAAHCGSGMVDQMYNNLTNFFDCLKNRQLIDKIETVKPKLYVSKFKDMSEKYGVGYQLTDQTIGIYFNDSTSLINNGSTYEYLEQQIKDKKKIIIKEAFSIVPDKLLKKYNILLYFKKHFLPPNGSPNMEFVIKYMKTKKAMIFRLSNRIIQLNFDDDSCLLLSDNATTITFFQNDLPVTFCLGELLAAETKILEKVKYAHSVLASLLLRRTN